MISRTSKSAPGRGMVCRQLNCDDKIVSCQPTVNVFMLLGNWLFGLPGYGGHFVLGLAQADGIEIPAVGNNLSAGTYPALSRNLARGAAVSHTRATSITKDFL